MRIVAFGAEDGYASDEFGSTGFTVTPLARLTGTAACLRLRAGGAIGRHPATDCQVFAVVAGSGMVSGDDGVPASISVGQAAIWEAGEEHETRSTDGLTAFVVEGPVLDMLLPLKPRTN